MILEKKWRSSRLKARAHPFSRIFATQISLMKVGKRLRRKRSPGEELHQFQIEFDPVGLHPKKCAPPPPKWTRTRPPISQLLPKKIR